MRRLYGVSDRAGENMMRDKRWLLGIWGQEGVYTSLKKNLSVWIMLIAGLIFFSMASNGSLPDCSDYVEAQIQARDIFNAQKQGKVVSDRMGPVAESCRSLPAFNYQALGYVLTLLCWVLAIILSVRKNAAEQEKMSAEEVLLNGHRYKRAEIFRIDEPPPRMGLAILATCMAVCSLFALIFGLERLGVGQEFRDSVIRGLNALGDKRTPDQDTILGSAVIGGLFIAIFIFHKLLSVLVPLRRERLGPEDKPHYLLARRQFDLTGMQKLSMSLASIVLAIVLGWFLLGALKAIDTSQSDLLFGIMIGAMTLIGGVSAWCIFFFPLMLFEGMRVTIVATEAELEAAGIDYAALPEGRSGKSGA